MRSADYLEMTTTIIAASGAGAVTMTAISGRPDFTTVFGSGKRWIRYIIEDTVSKKLEVGIGSVSANVLTRTKPQITWDGSATWNELAPTALTFSATPSSGDIKIRLGALAETAFPTLPAIQSTIAGDSNWRDYPLSANSMWASNGTGATLTADREYYAPYLLTRAGVLSGAQFECTGAIAASNLKWALYDCGSDGLPGAKIKDFVTQATTATGIITDTASASWTPAGKVFLTPGWYYVAFLPSHAIGIRFSGSGALLDILGPTPLGRKDAYGFGPNLYNSGSYSTGLPATPSLGSASMDSQAGLGYPWIGLKVDA